MAIISNPRPFTLEFGLPASTLEAEKLFDPVLNADTPLFIDPLLLAKSAHPKIATDATQKVRMRFERIYRLLSLPRTAVIQAALERLIKFEEVAGNCLGYTAGGIGGHGFGAQKQQAFLHLATQVQQAGRNDPDLLPVLAVLEGGIGPDLISDMTTNIIIDELCELTSDFCKRHEIPTEDFEIGMATYQLPRNRYSNRNREPVLLVPSDVLRELPVADNWDDVIRISQQNARLKASLNDFIMEIMRDTQYSLDQKRKLAAEAIQREAEAVARVGEFFASEPRIAYDTYGDPHTKRAIQRILGIVEQKFPLDQPLLAPNTEAELIELVSSVIEQFRFLTESHGVWKLFWAGDRRLREDVPQKVFHAIAHSYCKHHDVHIGVEHHTGNGRTDFIFTKGSKCVVVVELKWSDNQHLLNGYVRQLREYIIAEGAMRGFYVVLDCDKGEKYSKFLVEIAKPGIKTDDIAVVLVDANPKGVPSKPPL